MKDFLSIKEFSKLSGIASSTLRYWDEIKLFSPVKRNPENNYRYYSPEQIITVNFITVLSSLRTPLKTIRQIASNRTPESITQLIEHQEKLLDMEMSRLRECYSTIHTRREMINYGNKVLAGFELIDGIRVVNASPADKGVPVDINEIVLMRQDDIKIILGPYNEFKPGESFYRSFIHFCKQANNLRINLNFPIGALHNSWDGFMQAPGEPHHFFSIDPTGNKKRPAGKYLVAFHRGYYGQFGNLPNRMAQFIQDNSLVVSGPVYVMYLQDEVCIQDPSQYLAQICVAIS